MTSQNKFLRFSMFALLYFTQGTILGYFASLNALYLLDNGLDMARVGIFASIALIPFVIKIFFGMLSDRVNLLKLGHRNPYIVIGLLVQFICLLLVANINPGKQYWTFVALAFLLQLGHGFLRHLHRWSGPGYHPRTRTAVSCRDSWWAGAPLVSSWRLLLPDSSHKTWDGRRFSTSSPYLPSFPLPLLFFIKEITRTADMRFNWSAFRAFKNSQVLAAAAVGLIVFLVIVGANQNVNPHFTDLFRIDLSTAGLVTTVWGIGCVAGAFLGGVVMDKTGNKKALLLSLILVVPATALCWHSCLPNPSCGLRLFSLGLPTVSPRRSTLPSP